jgi:hypothetical protein
VGARRQRGLVFTPSHRVSCLKSRNNNLEFGKYLVSYLKKEKQILKCVSTGLVAGIPGYVLTSDSPGSNEYSPPPPGFPKKYILFVGDMNIMHCLQRHTGHVSRFLRKNINKYRNLRTQQMFVHSLVCICFCTLCLSSGFVLYNWRYRMSPAKKLSSKWLKLDFSKTFWK